MPININQGNIATFTVEFIDANGNPFVPSSSVLTINYTDVNANAVSTAINLTLINGIFTGTWDSTPAGLGLANYTVTSSSLVSPPAASGQVRIVTA